MSGADAILVLGVISSIISIVDGTKQIYDAATNAEGLPNAFREVAGRLPIVRNILGSAKQHINEGDIDEDSCKAVKHVVEACEKKAKKLDELFHKAIPVDGTSDLKRYYKAVQAYGKRHEIENLMKGMLEDVQLLACEHGMKTATKTQQEQITQAITELSAVASSVPEYVYQETSVTANNSGHSAEDIAQGGYTAQGQARQYIPSVDPMNFGSQDGEARACLTALFHVLQTDPCDDREKLIQVKGTRLVSTCEWIRSNELYKSWLCSHSQLLWISASPAKGKTMLAIFLAEELQRISRHSQDTVFLEFFCDNKVEKRNTAVTIIRGLIFQLLQLRPKLFNYILPSFKIQKESLFAGSSFETLWRIFETMLRDPVLGTTYCVIDGLDECDGASLEVLLKKFRALFSMDSSGSSPLSVNLIVFSRDLPDFIPEVLSSFPRIRLDLDADTEVNNDIHQFIEAKVDELSVHGHYPEPLCILVKEVFRNRAQGTFLWVGIAAKALWKYKATEVEEALDLLPLGLEELYARMLLQIDVDRREIAAKILRWVVMAVRPLTLSELSAAIESAAKPSVMFNCDEVMRDRVSYCGYFLTIKEDEVGLIHQSAKDYLLRKSCDLNPELEIFRVKEKIVNLEIARKCLDCLQNGALIYGKVDILRDTAHLKAFPLLRYAVLHWPEHARSLAHSEDIFDLSIPFYNKKSRVYISWLETYWRVKEFSDPPKSFTLLHLASYFGILPLAENLLLKKGLINKVKRLLYVHKMDGKRRTALIWAARRGHEAIVQLLLEKWSDINAKDKAKRTALISAAASGNEAVVQLLLEKGADVEVKAKDGKTALIWAIESANEAVVRLLLDKGADVEVKSKYIGTALIEAAVMGYVAVVQLLLDKGADIEAKGVDGNTALISAARYGYEDVVWLLLDKGADVEAKMENGETALIKVARNGHEAMVQLLLDKGADIEVKAEDGSTALIWAAIRGHEAVVRLLLEKRADVEVKDEDGRTALILATIRGHEAVVRLLPEKGADVEVKDEDGRTALIWAARCRHEAIVQLLLEKGADIEAKDEDGGTALILATIRGHEDMVRLLLEKGADVEVKDEDGRTALVLAAHYGYKAIVRLLTPPCQNS